jgi:hypothetical protein
LCTICTCTVHFEMGIRIISEANTILSYSKVTGP